MISGAKRRPYRTHFCRYLAAQFGERHSVGPAVQRVDLYTLVEETRPPGSPPRYSRTLLWREVLQEESAFDEAVDQFESDEQLHPGI